MRALVIITATLILSCNAKAVDFKEFQKTTEWVDFTEFFEKEAFSKATIKQLNSYCNEYLSKNPDTTHPLRGCIEQVIAKTDQESSYVSISTLSANYKKTQPIPIDVALLDKDTLYIQVPMLTQRSHIEISDKVYELTNNKEPKWILLDLRGNEGGPFFSAMDIANLFMPDNTPIFKLASSAHKKIVTMNSTASIDFFTGTPKHTPLIKFQKANIIVITDSKTSAGAEVLTSALREKRNAQQFGKTTSGKSSVFRMRAFSTESAIKLKTNEMISIKNETWKDHGLTPHVTITDEDIDKANRGNSDKDSWLATILKTQH